MKIEFLSFDLLKFYTGAFFGKQRFSKDIIKKFKNKIDFFIAAESINELSKVKSLNIEKYKGHLSARINRQYRIEFDFIKPDTIVILKISKHYEK